MGIRQICRNVLPSNIRERLRPLFPENIVPRFQTGLRKRKQRECGCPFCSESKHARIFFCFHGEEIRQCSACSLVYTFPFQTEEELEKYYAESYNIQLMDIERIELTEMDDLLSGKVGNFNRSRELSYLTPHKTKGKLLDLGCSWGYLMILAQRMGFEAWGVDVGRPYIEFADTRLGLNVFCGQLEHARFPSETFDGIIAVHSFEHLPDPRRTLLEMRRILKPDGVIVGFVPNFDSFLRKKLGIHWAFVQPENHYYHFAAPVLLRLFETAGFSVEFASEEGHYGEDGHYGNEEIQKHLSPSETREVHKNLGGSELIFVLNKKTACAGSLNQ